MSDEDDSPIADKLYSTPESKQKTRSKFKNILDDIELKLQKQNKKNVTNSNLETNSNTNKIEKNSEKNINANNNGKKIKNFNSSANIQSKKFENNKKIKDNNKNALLQRMKKDKEKKEKNIGIIKSQRNSINVFNKIDKNMSHNNKKLRASTPGIRNKEEDNNKNKINDKDNKNESKEKEKEIVDPLYIPHIVKDPLDILKQKVSKIMELSSEDLGNLSNKVSLMDTELEASLAKEHENYEKNLEIIYREKENKLKETYKKYDFALYKMFKTYGEKNNAIYDEMMKDKVDQILEIEQEFNIKKNKLKNNFNEKIEEIKRNYEKKREEQDILNKDLIKNIKKKLFDILYDKSININKKENNNINYNTFNNNEDENKKMNKTKSFFFLKKK